MRDAVERGDALRFRLRSMQRRLARAEATVAAALTVMQRPYLAWSGGKDSLLVLALAARQRPGIPAIWCDDELVEPETPTYVQQTAAALGARLLIVQGWARHAEWFDPWRERPFWREPESRMLWIRQRVETWSAAAGYDGALLGLRADESRGRRDYLRARGPLHATAQGWRCNPLAGWSVEDVWATIVGLNLPYNPVYDLLAAAGVPRAAQRVGPLPLAPRSSLAAWPGLAARLEARYGPHWH